MVHSVLAWSLIIAAIPAFVGIQATPADTSTSTADGHMAGTYVESLPDCEDGEICLAAVNQGARGDEYFSGVIHNATGDTVTVSTVSIALRDDAGEVSAAGDSIVVAPSELAPGDHALVLATLSGEFPESFTFEGRFTFETGPSASGFGTPVQVDSASVRGDAIVGEVTNTAGMDYPIIYVEGACFDDVGAITFRSSADIRGSLAIGDSAPFAMPIYDNDCDLFVVTAYGNPFA